MEPQKREEREHWQLMRRAAESEPETEPALEMPRQDKPQAEMERIRRGLEKFPANLVDWEATCLKNVADLLDGLQVARSEWEKFSTRLGEMRTALEAAKLEISEAREELEKTRAKKESLESEREGLATEQSRLTAEHAAEQKRLAAEKDEAAAEIDARRRQLQETRELLEAQRKEVAGLHRELEAAQIARADLEAQLAGFEKTREETRAEQNQLLARQEELAAAHEAELAEIRGRLGKVQRERDLLAEAGQARESARSELKQAQRDLELRQRDLERLRKECEENTVLVCDFRGRVNRLEEERDDALKQVRRKTRKIIDKVHAALDEVDAPSGGDMSYGERIRLLKRRIEVLEARLKHGTS